LENANAASKTQGRHPAGIFLGYELDRRMDLRIIFADKKSPTKEWGAKAAPSLTKSVRYKQLRKVS